MVSYPTHANTAEIIQLTYGPLVGSGLHYAFANIDRTVFNGIACGLQRITRACNALWVRRQQS